ncbi:hypothetical protein [Corynebacterium mayonis]|uniref:hypothetical protein n=1 Tax=Corynebacterium mayonis TaxID=3062461 RepID=UPI00313FE759
MNEPRNRVATFMASGFLVAILTGLAVWQLSPPTSPEGAGFQAQEPSLVSKNPAMRSSAREMSSSPAAPSTSSPAHTSHVASGLDVDVVEPGADQPVAAPPRDLSHDPLLPPNAVVNEDPQPITPTQVYRPTNVIPTSMAPEEATAQIGPEEGEEPTSTPPELPSETGEVGQPTEPTAPTIPPVLPATPPQEPPSTIPSTPIAETPQPQPGTNQQATPGSINAPWWERLLGRISL